MIVQEKLEITADDECMERLLVDYREFLDPMILPWIEYLERELGLLVRLRRFGRDGQVEVELDRVGNARDEGHPAPGAFPRNSGKDVRVHRTRVREILGRIGSGARLRRRHGGTLIGSGRNRLSARAERAQEKERNQKANRRHESVVSFHQEIVKARTGA